MTSGSLRFLSDPAWLVSSHLGLGFRVPPKSVAQRVQGLGLGSLCWLAIVGMHALSRANPRADDQPLQPREYIDSTAAPSQKNLLRHTCLAAAAGVSHGSLMRASDKNRRPQEWFLGYQGLFRVVDCVLIVV